MSEQQRGSLASRAIVVLKDLGSFAVGWAILLKQAGILFEAPSQPSEVLIGVGALIIGVPGFTHLWAARSGQTTVSPPSQPPAAESSPSSSGA